MTAAASAEHPSDAPPAPAPPGEAPVELTEAAAAHIRQLIEREGNSPQEVALRVAIIGGGCSGLSYKLAFEKEPRKRDKVYQAHGVRIYMDPKSALYLRGTRIDFVDSLSGTGFTFTNPNASASCGCGQSFSV